MFADTDRPDGMILLLAAWRGCPNGNTRSD